MSNLTGKKLGLMLSAPPVSENFNHALNLAAAALKRGLSVYLYCIDRAVDGLNDPRFAALKENGVKLFACAYSMHERELENTGNWTLSGLTILSDLIANTDHFASFN